MIIIISNHENDKQNNNTNNETNKDDNLNTIRKL